MWRSVAGADLVEFLAEGQLGDAIPSCSAIYAWKWHLLPDRISASSAGGILQWIDDLSRMPYGRRIEMDTAYLHMGDIRLRPSSLSEAKRAVLSEFLARSGNREWFVRYVQALSQHAPALYVGETGDLPKRTRDHLTGESDFGSYVRSEPGLSWEALDLYYAVLNGPSDQESEVRKTLEFVSSIVAIAGFTTRPG